MAISSELVFEVCDIAADHVVVFLSGEFDISYADAVERELRRLVDGGARRLAIDLSETTFLDSSALGVLLRIRKVLAELGGVLDVRAPSRPVSQVLAVSGVEEILGLRRRGD